MLSRMAHFDRARRPMEQLGADARFKKCDGAADCGRRPAKSSASARKTAFVKRRDEHLHCIDAVHDFSSSKEYRAKPARAFGVHPWLSNVAAGPSRIPDNDGTAEPGARRLHPAGHAIGIYRRERPDRLLACPSTQLPSLIFPTVPSDRSAGPPDMMQ
ncbi:MAG TPA: hypothetical protein VME47_18355 [Acetobacteraceae bacterium]|nr:hypothetical protein [Acetobacteraceae bacterium]